MRPLWILLVALAVTYAPALRAQEEHPSQSAPIAATDSGAGQDDAQSVDENSIPAHKHPVAGAPSMELGVDHIHSLDSDEVTDEYPAPAPTYARQESTANSQKKKHKNKSEFESDEAYRRQMETQYPGWYY